MLSYNRFINLSIVLLSKSFFKYANNNYKHLKETFPYVFLQNLKYPGKYSSIWFLIISTLIPEYNILLKPNKLKFILLESNSIYSFIKVYKLIFHFLLIFYLILNFSFNIFFFNPFISIKNFFIKEFKISK